MAEDHDILQFRYRYSEVFSLIIQDRKELVMRLNCIMQKFSMTV